MKQLKILMQAKNCIIKTCLALFLVFCFVNCNAKDKNMPTFEYRGITCELFPVNPDSGRPSKVDALISLFVEDSIGIRLYSLECERYHILVAIRVDSSGNVVDVTSESYLDDIFCETMKKIHFNDVQTEFSYNLCVRFVCDKEKSYLEKWLKREKDKIKITKEHTEFLKEKKK